MTTSIKITELTSIGANISHTSLAPVVDMAGTPETKKATLQTVGNLILSEAGGTNFVPANVAIVAQTVSNAAQPAITSVGTLTSLDVTGDITANNLGNIASIDIDGNASSVLRGDGTFGSLSSVTTNTIKTTPVTVAGLPAASTAGAGARAFVTDADDNTFGAPVAGGGANNVPVYSDGSSWLIG